MSFICTGKIDQCLNCPLDDCNRGQTGKGKKRLSDRKDYYKDWYRRNRTTHLEKVKSNPKYVEKWGK